MKHNEIIFYDDTDDCERFDSTREYLYETQREEQGWLCLEEIPDRLVWEQINTDNEDDYYFFSQDLRKFMKDGHFLVVGVCGRWDGDFAGGDFVSDFDELISRLQHLDYIKFYEINGHFYIEGIHHDGRDRYEMKQLTNRGYEYAQQNDFAHDRKLHSNIMKCNIYSRLPHFAEKCYAV